jgi:hypothetical protein
MLYTAEKQPAVFSATCARLLPNDVRVTVEQSLPGNLSPSDWADLRELLSAIQSAMPNAADRPPGEVFRHVVNALSANASEAQAIEINELAQNSLYAMAMPVTR